MLSEPREAWTEVQAENQFNDPPEDGMEYWIVPLSVTYVGSETGLPWIDLTVQFVGDDARTYSDRCGVIPDDLMDVNELYEGGSAEGNVCRSVPAGAEGLWTLSTGWGGNTVFFDAGACRPLSGRPAPATGCGPPRSGPARPPSGAAGG